MDSLAASDSVKNESDSSGCDTSDCGAVGALIFLRLLYLDSLRKCFLLNLAACIVSVVYLVAFSDHGTVFKRPQ